MFGNNTLYKKWNICNTFLLIFDNCSFENNTTAARWRSSPENLKWNMLCVVSTLSMISGWQFIFRSFPTISKWYFTCISDLATDDVCVTVFVQWSENLVRTSPNNWNFPVLCAEFAWLDISDDLLVNVVRFEIRGILFVDVDGYNEAWFLKKVPDPSLGMLSTTRVNSVNCFVKKGVWSPWKYWNEID